MNSNDYKKTFDRITASERFQAETIEKMHHTYYKKREKKGFVITMNLLKCGIAALCAVLTLGTFASIPKIHSNKGEKVITAEAKENTTDEDGPIMASVIVNIEGIIVDVSEDGKSFKLDSGIWVVTTDKTEMGITGPTAAPKEEQFFEPTFRIGNSISGFTLDDSSKDEIKAHTIYTNWNWDNPIR